MITAFYAISTRLACIYQNHCSRIFAKIDLNSRTMYIILLSFVSSNLNSVSCLFFFSCLNELIADLLTWGHFFLYLFFLFSFFTKAASVAVNYAAYFTAFLKTSVSHVRSFRSNWQKLTPFQSIYILNHPRGKVIYVLILFLFFLIFFTVGLTASRY